MCEREILSGIRVLINNEGMIADNAVFLSIFAIARVAIHDMLNVETWLVGGETQQGVKPYCSASTSGEIADVFGFKALEYGGKHLYVSTLYGFARQVVNFVGICIGRIVGEIATENEEVVGIEVRLEGLLQCNAFLYVVGGNDDGNDRRHFLQPVLQEWKLHLEAMLTGMCTLGECDVRVRLCELVADLCVDFYLSEGRFIEAIARCHGDGVEIDLMARTDEEDALVSLGGIDA